MIESADPGIDAVEADELKLLFEVFEGAPRQGPGSVESTRHALRLLPDSLRRQAREFAHRAPIL